MEGEEWVAPGALPAGSSWRTPRSGKLEGHSCREVPRELIPFSALLTKRPTVGSPWKRLAMEGGRVLLLEATLHKNI